MMEKVEVVPELEQNQLKTNEINKLADEVNKLKMFLKTIQDGSCFIAQQGNHPSNSLHLSSLIASKSNRNDIWILDSGATDYMSSNPNVFSTYQTLVTPKWIVIANGTSILIKSQGYVTLNPKLIIKRVLHVPNLSANLISVHQLTKDLNC